MRGTIFGAALMAGVLVSGCTTDDMGGSRSGIAAGGIRASATLMDASGAQKGMATFQQDGTSVRLSVRATGMTPGAKGLHFHTTGRCDAPDFTTAGGHWNPSAMKHGKDSGMGPHMGDLPNIEIGPDGNGTIETTVPSMMLTGGATPLLDADGAAIIIHAGPDDYRTDPSGNSGARLACGVVTAA